MDNWGDSGERGCSDRGVGGTQPLRAGGAQSVWGARELGGHWGAPRLRGGGRGGQEMRQGAGWGAWGDTLTSAPLPQDRAHGGAGIMPSSKEQRWGAGKAPGRHQGRPRQHSWRVLAERNQSVAPVVVWVENAPGQPEQSPAFVSAPRAPSAGASLTPQHASKTPRGDQSPKRSFSQPEGNQEHGS